MANLFDYLYWRDDLPLDQAPLNEVDTVILTRLAYLPFEHLGTGREHMTIREAAVALLTEPALAGSVLQEADLYLLSALAHGKRFGDLQLMCYVNRLEEETQTQFCAVTVKLEENRHYVLFRGTDNTLVGWKENFNMAFTSPVPAQTAARDYLEQIASMTRGELLVGGHSKGGNLAVYAGACCSDETRRRIAHVYNLDGPGFPETMLETAGYRQICSRVSTYVPQSSVVGMLLEHQESYTIVHSSESVNLLQHDVYTWEVGRSSLTLVEEVTDGSRFIDATVKAWLAALEPEKREKFIDAVYAILQETNARTLKELRENWLGNGLTVLRAWRGLDEDTREVMTQVARALKQSAREELGQVLRSRPEHRLALGRRPEEAEE